VSVCEGGVRVLGFGEGAITAPFLVTQYTAVLLAQPIYVLPILGYSPIKKTGRTPIANY
jgi:hypothetical protein